MRRWSKGEMLFFVVAIFIFLFGSGVLNNISFGGIEREVEVVVEEPPRGGKNFEDKRVEDKRVEDKKTDHEIAEDFYENLSEAMFGLAVVEWEKVRGVDTFTIMPTRDEMIMLVFQLHYHERAAVESWRGWVETLEWLSKELSRDIDNQILFVNPNNKDEVWIRVISGEVSFEIYENKIVKRY